MDTGKLVRYMSDVLEQNGINNCKEILLQLLAWDKLEREGKVKEEFSLQKAQTLFGQEAFHFIIKAFHFLSQEELLGGNSYAFDSEKWSWSLFTQTNFAKIIDSILSTRKVVLDYQQAIKASLEIEGKGSFLIPNEILELMVQLAKVDSSSSVYCPFEANYGLAEKINLITPSVYTEGVITSPLPFLINILLDRSIQVRFSDPISNPGWKDASGLKVFDISVAIPPIGIRYTEERYKFDFYNRFPEKILYGDVLHIRHMLAQTSSRVIVAVSNGVLFRTSAGERQFKNDLLRNGLLEAVIALPSSLLPISGLSISILILNKQKRFDKIVFVDASSEHFFEKKSRTETVLKHVPEILDLIKVRENSQFSYLATLSECESNDYNLIAERYVFSGKEAQLQTLLNDNKSIELEELVDFLRVQSLKDELVDEDIKCYEIAVNDISDEPYIYKPKKSFFLSKKLFNKLENQRLQPYDILLAIKGSIGKVGLVGKAAKSENWFANQSFQVLRLENNKYIKDPIVLYRYLCSPAGQAVIKSRATGAAVPMLQNSDIKSLPIIILPEKKQKEVIADHEKIVSIYQNIRQLQEEANDISNKWWVI